MSVPSIRTLRAAVLCTLLLAVAWRTARAFRPYAANAEAKTSWMTVSSNGREYYLEVAADGAVVSRTATKSTVVTRRGVIKPMLAKDFFREVESSDIINSQGARESKLLFYKGDKLSISAYVSGEIRRIKDAPLDNFGEAFSYAFNEVKKASEKLEVDEKLYGFLMAEPLEKDSQELKQYEAQAPKETGTIEIYDIQKLKPLMKAIKQPYRLIPLENEDGAREIQTFITSHKLYGLRKIFYLPSTRGTFRCYIMEAAKKQVVEPEPAETEKSSEKANPKL